MHTSRRTFLKTSTLAVAGTALFSETILSEKKRKKIVGIQLYSVRDDMKKDPLDTLKQLAAMDYKYVEHANYVDRKFYGYTASEFKKILKDLDLKMPSGHTVMGRQHWDEAKKDFTDSWKYTVEDAATLDQQFVISPWLDESLRKTYDDILRYMEVFNKSGELCKKSGMKFGYHNHDFEFSQKLNDKTVYDIILQNTDPALVAQQLDIGNMYHGGGRAMDVLQRYPGRIESMHVKDEVKPVNGANNESTVLGTGIIGVKEVVDYARDKGGTKYFIIEQEAYQGITPLQSAKENLQVMRKWGY